MTNIQPFISAYYAFYKRQDFLSYIANLLYKDKFLCNDIENLSNVITCCEKG